MAKTALAEAVAMRIHAGDVGVAAYAQPWQHSLTREVWC